MEGEAERSCHRAWRAAVAARRPREAKAEGVLSQETGWPRKETGLPVEEMQPRGRPWVCGTGMGGTGSLCGQQPSHHGLCLLNHPPVVLATREPQGAERSVREAGRLALDSGLLAAKAKSDSLWITSCIKKKKAV